MKSRLLKLITDVAPDKYTGPTSPPTFRRIMSSAMVVLSIAGPGQSVPASSQCNPGFTALDTVGVLYSGNQVLDLADLDGDGDLDVAGGRVSEAGVIYLAWWENLLPAQFGQRIIDTTVGGPLASGDIDGDGDTDLVCATATGLIWLENAGNGTFSRHYVDSAGSSGGNTIELIDLDGDLDLDIVSLFYSEVPDSLNIVWSAFENDGNAQFTQHHQRAVGYLYVLPRPQVVSCVDLDGDGDPEVVTPGDTLGPILLWENLGGMVFSFDSIPGQVDGVIFVTAADVDSDNDEDLVATAYTSDGEVYWWENVGSMDFILHLISSDAGFRTFISARDLDYDGDVDLSLDHPFSWWENDGDENFSSRELTGAVTFIGGTVLAGDVDGDCRSDLVATYGFGGNTIVWWRNECPLLCACHADPQCDSVISDVQDVVVTISVAFRGQAPVADVDCGWERTDVDCSGATDVLDVVHVIAVAFRNANVGAEYCDPCP